MTKHANLVDLAEENRVLRKAITDARQQLKTAVGKLREMIDDEMFSSETPLEVDYAMQKAASEIVGAIQTLGQAVDAQPKGTSTVPGGPTRQQGQFLAYIREYMARNHLGVAPTHAELQRFFNLTPPSVNSMLKRLDEKGFIRRTPGKARAIELTIEPELIPALDRPFK